MNGWEFLDRNIEMLVVAVIVIVGVFSFAAIGWAEAVARGLRRDKDGDDE